MTRKTNSTRGHLMHIHGLLFSVLAISLAAAPPDAEQPYTSVAGTVQYQPLGTYTVERLNRILTEERQAFAPFEQTYTPAKYPVTLYRVLYASVIPEWDNKPTTASGLIAIPETGQKAELPVVSYQHGTTLSKTEAPSHPEESYETRLMVAQFAGQGYIVVAADYFGKGESTEPDSYTVKASTQQACLDLLLASRHVCQALEVGQGPLFLSGWSQGGFSTMAFLNKLESVGIPVTAAATASCFNDMFATTNHWIHAPAKMDAEWLPAILAINLHAYEAYYRLPGLATTAIRPAYQEPARKLYRSELSYADFRKQTTGKVTEFLTPEFQAQSSRPDTRYWQLVQENQVFFWRSKTPLHTYYGEVDEACPAYIAQLPVGYQASMNGAATKAVSAGPKADHRGTFLFAVADQKAWFDQLLLACCPEE